MAGTALYVLGNQYLALLDKLQDGDFDDATIADTIEASGIVDDFNEKARGIVAVQRTLLANHDAIDDELDRLRALKDRRTKAAARLGEYLLTEMQRTGITRIEGPSMVISLRDNPPAVDVYDARMIPAEFMRQPLPPEPTPDKVQILAALKAGTDVPGARIVRKQRVQIA